LLILLMQRPQRQKTREGTSSASGINIAAARQAENFSLD